MIDAVVGITAGLAVAFFYVVFYRLVRRIAEGYYRGFR